MRRDLIRRVAVCFVILQAAALLAIAAGGLVPDDRVLDQVATAVEEGDITRVTTVAQRGGGIADRFGECVTATIGTGDAGLSWFESVALSPNLGSCPVMIDRLDARADGESIRGVTKVRYWNGLSAVVRPLLAVFGVVGTRVVAALALAGSAVWLTAALARTTDRVVALAAAVPLVLLTDPRGLVGVFHHPLMAAVGLAGAALLVRRAGSGARPADLGVAAFVAAGVYSFVDLMNFVVGMWVAAAMLVGLAVPASAGLRRLARSVGAVFVAWPAGYLSMWFGAWFWAGLASSPGDVLDEIRAQVEFRINGSSQYATGAFGAGLRANLSFWRNQDAGTSLIGLLAIVAVLCLVVGIRRGGDVRPLAVVLGPALVVVPWYLITNNHNEIHYWFEYRSLGLVFAVGFAVAVSSARGRFRPIRR